MQMRSAILIITNHPIIQIKNWTKRAMAIIRVTTWACHVISVHFLVSDRIDRVRDHDNDIFLFQNINYFNGGR